MRALNPKLSDHILGKNSEQGLDLSLDIEDSSRRELPLTGREKSDRFATIAKLESRVSMIQVARKNIELIAQELRRIKEAMEQVEFKKSNKTLPPRVVNSFLKDRIKKVEAIISRARFESHLLLNGETGVTGVGSVKNLKFIKGSGKVISSNYPGYPVTIYQNAKPSILMGGEEVNRGTLKYESLIAVADGTSEIRYKLKWNENPNTLVQNLQHTMFEHGLNMKVLLTKHKRLFFIHNQLGADVSFRGLSSKTRLVSVEPGISSEALPGRDITGTIGLETAYGVGGFLMGTIGNRRTDGLVIFYDGPLKYPGQIVGYIQVQQNGTMVPVDLSGNEAERLIFPTLKPENLGIGVANQSQFPDLASVRGNTVQECRDTLKMAHWALCDLDQVLEELRWKEDCFVNRTIGILQNSISPRIAGEEIVIQSQNKAGEMEKELKEMLSLNQSVFTNSSGKSYLF